MSTLQEAILIFRSLAEDLFSSQGPFDYEANLEYIGGTSKKFWRVRVADNKATRWWGRIGTAGQKKTESFPIAGAAKREAMKIAGQKKAKGYMPSSSSLTAAPAPKTGGPKMASDWERRSRVTTLDKLRPYDDWSMFTKAGNRRLESHAKKTVDRLKQAAGRADYFKAAKAILKDYVEGWQRIGNTKAFGEANDTAVREVVGDFYDKMADAVYGDVWTAMDNKADWDSVY